MKTPVSRQMSEEQVFDFFFGSDVLASFIILKSNLCSSKVFISLNVTSSEFLQFQFLLIQAWPRKYVFNSCAAFWQCQTDTIVPRVRESNVRTSEVIHQTFENSGHNSDSGQNRRPIKSLKIIEYLLPQSQSTKIEKTSKTPHSINLKTLFSGATWLYRILFNAHK